MLLETYHLEIFNSECMPGAMGVHCFAHLDQDVSEALPYLNAVLGGDVYLSDPPSVTFKAQGKLITVSGRKIAINALKDEAEAGKLVEWLKNEINQAWENRAEITPCYKGRAKPQLIEILKLLPRTNCKKCGQPTCMVFAAQVMDGGRGPDDCPELSQKNREKLGAYLSGFDFG
ncbi:(Fe-S)-binding protein [Desulfosudis oleivorans]|uniref:Fe-S cluster domain protein n=1 Tax=Desulfosudis oleivorans (strain DSM 6200 / JCM 39069 / Hxd3) TaxID=96561 RepID=A8ZYF8_DESOH|nr:(Fe-S)-binding protein [Desulfosudis oleivorans]ABW68683.1 Fe-S cluster domain protein [Desulfosudis oleivorans Hxd3]